jgi:hypothetical protein
MLSTMWSNEDWSEVLFLIAFILFAIAAIAKLTKQAVGVPLTDFGLAATALGLLAL